MRNSYRIAAAWLLLVAASGCKSTEETYYRGGDEVQLIEAIPPSRPDWLNVPPTADARFYYFVGTSENASAEVDAKDMAVAAALKKAAAYAGVSIRDKSERLTESRFKASETADPMISETQKTLQTARAYFGQARPEQWYIEPEKTANRCIFGQFPRGRFGSISTTSSKITESSVF